MVIPYGPSKEKQQISLPKNIFRHKNSSCHLKALAILEQRNRESIPQYNAKMQMKVHEETCRVFRTAYKIGKHERPFCDVPLDIDVQKMNGADLGRV